jgi:hypothetical protein
MQSESKFTEYLKAIDDNDPLRRGLNNLIKQGLGDEYKLVTDLAEAKSVTNYHIQYQYDSFQ